MKKKIEQVSDLEKVLEADLLREYGPLLTGRALCKALGYPSLEALRQAVARDKVPVPIFPLPNRRGKFALAKDVAAWLADQRSQVDK
ncbi:MAG: pyocin activator PrtN family protein [Candidatus Thiodiazotropha taylori]|nr:pyocin activator PrtN family protein [Candidatus Thiodiazotropha taylori]MCG7972003.1 pyocin activator PrtN family protein [Candidatus Thiodiazotropha taylori]